MRTILFSACLALAATSQAGDREGEGPRQEREGPQEQSPEKFAEGLTKGLELDAKQAEKVKSLFKDSQERSKAKRAEMKALQEKMKGLHKELMEEHRRLEERIREELTLEQKERFDMMRLKGRRMGGPGERREMREERRKIRFERREGEGPGRGGRRMEWEEEDAPRRFPPEMWEERRGGSGGGPAEGPDGPPEDGD